MKDVLLFPATVESIRTRKDGTAAVTMGTQELSPAVAGQLFGLQNAIVFVALKVEDFGKAEIEMLEALKADPMETGRKSEAQRLRAVLYRLWEQNPEGYKDANLYYIAKMEKFITHLKSKLT